MKNKTEFKEITRKMERLMIENFYEYIRSKAKTFYLSGYKKYRRHDAFGQPAFRMTPRMQSLIKSGCWQVLDCKGLTPADPFDELGIPGFYRLMEMFHYKVVAQRIAKAGETFIIDEMHMVHTVMGQKMILYNKVSKPKINKGPLKMNKKKDETGKNE